MPKDVVETDKTQVKPGETIKLPEAVEKVADPQLIEAAEKGFVVKVVPQSLTIDNVRDWPEEKVRKRAESMQAVGLLEKITINTKASVFNGTGRVLAAIMLGWEHIEATVIKTDLTVSEWKIRQLSTSIHTEKLSDCELYENCMLLLNLRPDWKQVDLAKYLAVDEPTVSKWISPSKTTERCREAFKKGEIGFTEIQRLSRIPFDQQDMVVPGILSGAIPNRDALDSVVKQIKQEAAAGKTPKPPKPLSKVKYTLPTKASVTVAGVQTVQDLLKAAGELVKSAKKFLEEKPDDLASFEQFLKGA